MYKARYDDMPLPVSVERQTNHKTGEIYLIVRVTANAEKELDPDSKHEVWVVDENAFSEKESVLDLAAVEADPAAYLHYFPVEFRQRYKDEAQKLLDDFRNGCPVVPVPSYREGAAVCNRANDKSNLMGALLMGGVECYELASGEIVSLTKEEIMLMAQDVAAAETAWQLGKQACWTAVDSAHSEAEMQQAVATYKELLGGYAKK